MNEEHDEDNIKNFQTAIGNTANPSQEGATLGPVENNKIDFD